MEDDFYKTAAKSGVAELTDRKSRFIAAVGFAASRPDFTALLEREKKKYPDATHHCWAFRIGFPQPEELSGDDGEPSGSAGLPILRVLTGADLTNVACIVTRYFGGTKLGVGGLMRAYSQAASAAVQNAAIIERPITERFRIALPYDIHSDFERALKKNGGKILEAEYESEVRIIYELPTREIESLEETLANISKGKVKAKRIKKNI